MKPLRFAMVTTFYPPYHFGGDGVGVYRLSEALAARGHSVEVIHSRDAYHLRHPGEPEIGFDHHPRVTRRALRSRWPLGSALLSHQLGSPGPYAADLRRWLADGRHDVVHFHNVSLLGGPGVLRLGRGVKLYTAHEYWLICPTHVLYRYDREPCTRRTCWRCTLRAHRPPQVWRSLGLRRRALQVLDCLLMPSRFARDQHRAQGIDRPMRVLPHFVPRPDRAADPDTPPPGSSKPYFLAVGRLEGLKGFQDLLPLFAAPPLLDTAELWLVGEGDFGDALRRRAGANVRFLGAVHPDALDRLYRHAVALLAPSRCYETFGLTVIEALARGTPALVRGHGALRELIDDSGAGFTFDTPAECAAAMARLLADPGERQRLGDLGRRSFEERWSEEVHLGAYLGLVEELRAASGPSQEAAP